MHTGGSLRMATDRAKNGCKGTSGFVKPILIGQAHYQTASVEHWGQVKVNDW